MMADLGEALSDVMKLIAGHIVIFIVAAVLILALIVFLIVKAVKKHKKKKETKAIEQLTQAEHTEDGRFSLKEDIVSYKPDGEANASFTKQDVIVGKGQTIVAGKNNDIAVGKWVVLTTMDGVEAFNVRINGFVREITHNSTIVLGEGDSICPVSHSIILR